MSLISYGIMLVNLFAAMVVFVLLTRPEKMFGIISYFVDLRKEWLAGRLKDDDYARLEHVAGRLEWFALLTLFTFSFLCGSLIAIIQLGALQ